MQTRSIQQLKKTTSKMNQQDDLDLLLSLEDRVIETPPASPSGCLLDDELPRHRARGNVDMSVFRDVVHDCLDYNPKDAKVSQKPDPHKGSDIIEVDKFSGLRIQNPVVSRVELSNHLSDIRFVRLPTIKNLLHGDSLSGCWATIGVVTQTGIPRTSSIGKAFTILKIGCLDDESISLFLFDDAYRKNCKEKVGTIFALLNCVVRMDRTGEGFSLNIYSGKHILKLGMSADIGFCQGEGRNGPCATAIDKRFRKYCSQHKKDASKKYNNTRTELNSGNLKTGFRDYLKCKGIYVVKPPESRANFMKSNKPVKVLSVEGLKKALSKADKVTTNTHSQGIRFLNHVTGNMGSKVTTGTTNLPHKQKARADDRSFNLTREPCAKKLKTDQREGLGKDSKKAGSKMIELDFASSDEEI